MVLCGYKSNNVTMLIHTVASNRRMTEIPPTPPIYRVRSGITIGGNFQAFRTFALNSIRTIVELLQYLSYSFCHFDLQVYIGEPLQIKTMFSTKSSHISCRGTSCPPTFQRNSFRNVWRWHALPCHVKNYFRVGFQRHLQWPNLQPSALTRTSNLLISYLPPKTCLICPLRPPLPVWGYGKTRCFFVFVF